MTLEELAEAYTAETFDLEAWAVAFSALPAEEIDRMVVLISFKPGNERTYVKRNHQLAQLPSFNQAMERLHAWKMANPVEHVPPEPEPTTFLGPFTVGDVILYDGKPATVIALGQGPYGGNITFKTESGAEVTTTPGLDVRYGGKA